MNARARRHPGVQTGAALPRRTWYRVGLAAGLSLLLPPYPAMAQAKGAATGARFPDVVAATVRARSATMFDFDVTVSSPYDTPQRYADGFRVTRLTGELLGERTLWHDHQDEQPFTRDLHGVTIPVGVRTVRIQARDRKHGYGGRSIELALPGRR